VNLSHNDLLSPISRALYALEITPNQMAYWTMLVAAKAIIEKPMRLTAIRCELFPVIEKYTGCSPEAIDSLLRRTSRQMMEDESFAPLRAYLPKGATHAPPVGVFLSMWVRMVEDYMRADWHSKNE